jgi:phosphonate transport system permease protein
MIREFPEAWPPLSRILWPWEAAVTRDTASIQARAAILVDSTENPPAVPEFKEGKPYLKSTPTYGKMSTLDEKNKMVSGDRILLEGSGFAPDTETFIFWADPNGNEFRPRQDGAYVSLVTDAEGSFTFDLIIPYRLTPPSAEGQQIHHVEARQTSEVGPVKASEPMRLTIVLMLETIFMGMMATLFGIILAIPLSFLASRNLMSGSWLTITIYYVVRTIFNITRSIEPMIWALIAVVWVGLGPFAGILALTIHSIAALGKLYSESIESIDPGPIEAIQATGANKIQTIMFAVVPQMIPPFVSFTIYRWDINVRMSTVIGMVGGGGIGFLLVQYIRLLDYKSAGIAVWFIAITVAILDYVSSKIREKFV